jgi:uncharacterized ion transporter superfamily protein YfcC
MRTLLATNTSDSPVSFHKKQQNNFQSMKLILSAIAVVCLSIVSSVPVPSGEYEKIQKQKERNKAGFGGYDGQGKVDRYYKKVADGFGTVWDHKAKAEIEDAKKTKKAAAKKKPSGRR